MKKKICYLLVGCFSMSLLAFPNNNTKKSTQACKMAVAKTTAEIREQRSLQDDITLTCPVAHQMTSQI